MEQQAVALRFPGALRREEAAALVQSVSEPAAWGTLEVEIFPGREETLLLIHPASGVYITSEAYRALTRWCEASATEA